jgi:MFS family permease
MSSPESVPKRATQAPQSLREAWIALAGLSAVFLFEMLDNSILNVALPTIGRDLHAPALSLEWVTGVYAVVFGGLMLAFGAIADRFGRRRVMLVGLVLLGLASLATAFVTTSAELIAVRAVMGAAAAMTTPGSIALAFRLFHGDKLRVRAMSLISTVGLVGLAIGPTVGGLVLAIAPWQVLLLVNVPIAILAFIGIRLGIAKDDGGELYGDPIDIAGAVLGTGTIVLALITPTLFVNEGVASWAPWTATGATVLAGIFFAVRERSARYPLLDLNLVTRPLVSSGLAFKAATGLAVAGLGYLVTLQLQLDWGWPPYLASIGMLPQVIVLIFGGPFANRFIERVGLERAAWLSAIGVVVGLAIYALLSSFGYVWIAVALALVAAGIRVNGVAAGTNVLRGLPKNRTSIGSALVDTASEVATAVGIAVGGTILAALFVGSITSPHWTATQTGQFREAILIAGIVLTIVAAALVTFGIARSRAGSHSAPESAPSSDGTQSAAIAES